MSCFMQVQLTASKAECLQENGAVHSRFPWDFCLGFLHARNEKKASLCVFSNLDTSLLRHQLKACTASVLRKYTDIE